MVQIVVPSNIINQTKIEFVRERKKSQPYQSYEFQKNKKTHTKNINLYKSETRYIQLGATKVGVYWPKTKATEPKNHPKSHKTEREREMVLSWG